MHRMRAVISFLAAGRVRAVGLALVVELAALVPLGQIRSMPDGVAVAIATAIAGTVAVVEGPLAGVVVALAGATAFGFADDWGTGERAALVVWPAIVLGAGLFASALQRERRALGHAVAEHESERERLAFELHEETAQRLFGALAALRTALRESEAAPAESVVRAHDLIEETIHDVRALAVELRPKTLDDFGLVAAVEGLAANLSAQTGSPISVSDNGIGTTRLPRQIELVLYRVVQQTLASLGVDGHDARVVLDLDAETASVEIELDDALDLVATAGQLSGLRERVRLLEGRLAVGSTPGPGTTVRAEVPLSGREHANGASPASRLPVVDLGGIRRHVRRTLRPGPVRSRRP